MASLHQVLGVWAWLFLVVLLSTGAYLTYITVSGSLPITGVLRWWRREHQAKLKNRSTATRRLPATSQ